MYSRVSVCFVRQTQVHTSCLEKGAEPVFVNVKGALESIPPAYVAWWTSMSNRVDVPALQAGNRFLGSLKRFINTGSELCWNFRTIYGG